MNGRNIIIIRDAQVCPADDTPAGPSRSYFSPRTKHFEETIAKIESGEKRAHMLDWHQLNTGAIGLFDKLWIGKNEVDPSDTRPWLHGSGSTYSRGDIPEDYFDSLRSRINTGQLAEVSGSWRYDTTNSDPYEPGSMELLEISLVPKGAVLDSKLLTVEAAENSSGKPSIRKNFPTGQILSFDCKQETEKMAAPTPTSGAASSTDSLAPEIYLKAWENAKKLRFQPTAEDTATLTQLLSDDPSGAKAATYLMSTATENSLSHFSAQETDKEELQAFRAEKEAQQQKLRDEKKGEVGKFLDTLPNLTGEKREKTELWLTEMAVNPHSEFMWKDVISQLRADADEKSAQASKYQTELSKVKREFNKKFTAQQAEAAAAELAKGPLTANKRAAATEEVKSAIPKKIVSGADVPESAIPNDLKGSNILVQNGAQSYMPQSLAETFPNAIQFSASPHLAALNGYLRDVQMREELRGKIHTIRHVNRDAISSAF